MEERCRCCLKTSINLVEILIDDEEKFQNCTGNKEFSKNDGLSQSCCKYCYKKIQDIYIFQEQCKNSDLFLKNLLLNNNIKYETNEINNLLEIQYNNETFKKEKLEDSNIIVSPNDETFEIVNYGANENLEQNSEVTVNVQSSLNCNKCKKSFTSSKNLKLHIAKVHKTDKDNEITIDVNLTEMISFKCKFCNDVFQKHSMLLKHLSTVHLPNSESVNQEKFNECESVEKPVKEENIQILHELKNDESTIKLNEIIPQYRKKLHNENKFWKQNRKLNKFAKYHCHLCGMKFARKHYLITHFKITHLKIMEFTCKLCWKGYEIYDVFHNHLIKIHLKQNTAPTKDEMDKYLINNHDPDFSNLLWKDIKFPAISKINEIKNKYECKLCDKPFNSKISLKFHFCSVHLKLTNISHKCNICSKIFRYKYSLIQHRKNHNFIVKQICSNTNFLSTKKFEQDYIANCLVNNKKKLKSVSFHQWPEKISVKNELEIPSNHYNCNYCNIKFGAKRYLKVHMKRKHANAIIHQSQFECLVCNIIFTKQYLLRNHMKDVHPEKYAQLATPSNRYNCNYCDITFGARRYLQVHMRRKHADIIILPNQFDCSVCNDIFPKQYLLRNHIKDNHPEEYIQLGIPSNRFNCNYCDNTFGEKRYLKGHMRRHHPNVIIPPNKIECSICNNIFTKQYLLRNHMRDDHLEEYTQLAIPSTRYNCDYCDNTFGAKRYLNVHMRRKHANSIIPNQFECTVCNNIFNKQYLYTNHMKDNHPDEYAQLIRVNCKICNKSYSTKSIQSHLKIHENRPKNIQCPECGRTFFSQSSFNYHQKTHSNEKPFKCSFDRCSKAFLTNFQLVSHFNTHADVKKPKRYHCDYCGKGCTSTTEIKVHLRIHTKERPFKCTLCDKGFLTKTHLRNHSYTHTGEKNYKCKEDGCKSSYVSISSLKKHYYTVHFPEDQKTYQCDLCFKKFAQRTFLNQHRKAHGKIARIEKN